MGTRMWILRQHTWRRSANSVIPIAVSDDPSLLEERAQGILPEDKDDLLVWTEVVWTEETDGRPSPSIRYSSVWTYANAEHYFSITTIPNLTR